MAKVKTKTKLKEYRLPKIREPKCEHDLYFLIGRYWNSIREKIGLEDIVFVDRHWDAEGIYKGKKVRIEVKVDAKDFDKDPTKIDLLICWKITPSGNILGQIYFDELKNAEYRSNKAKLWALTYNLSEEQKECLKKLRLNQKSGKELIKEIFKCVGIDVIELSEILRVTI